MVEEHPRVTVGVVVAVVVLILGTVLFNGVQVSNDPLDGRVVRRRRDGPRGRARDGGRGRRDRSAGIVTGRRRHERRSCGGIQPALLIVRTGTLRLEIGSAAALSSTVSKAANLVTAGGGYVAGSKETGADADASATVDYRIPAAAWEQILAGLRSLATVKGQEIGTEEVTGKVVDLGARIANLRATEAALQAIMAKATKIEDVLDVQRQLTDTRGQIEELAGQKAQLEDRAAYGSLTVIFAAPAAPAPRATPAPAAAWDPGADVNEAGAKLSGSGSVRRPRASGSRSSVAHCSSRSCWRSGSVGWAGARWAASAAGRRPSRRADPPVARFGTGRGGAARRVRPEVPPRRRPGSGRCRGARRRAPDQLDLLAVGRMGLHEQVVDLGRDRVRVLARRASRRGRPGGSRR